MVISKRVAKGLRAVAQSRLGVGLCHTPMSVAQESKNGN